MNDERIDDYLGWLDDEDAAADYRPEWYDQHAPSFDEWNARRVIAGLPVGTFAEYLREINPRRGDGAQENYETN